MTPSHAKKVQRQAGETDRQFARRQAGAAVVRPIFGDVLAQPGQTVVRSEQHHLSAGIGSATTAETLTRRAESTPEDTLKARTAALPKKLQGLVATGLPITTAELLALVLAHYQSKQAPAKLDPGTVASALGLRREDGAKTLTDAIARGLLIPEMGVFGTNGGYRPAAQLLWRPVSPSAAR